MNPHPTPPPADAELDRLLASQLQRTSPDFELRWRQLRGTLFNPHHASAEHERTVLHWAGIVATAFAAAVVALMLSTPPLPPSGADDRTFEELLALDAALAPATALLASEHRDVLLNLPASPAFDLP